MSSSSINFAQPDVTLGLDLSGVIRRASLSNAISAEGIDGWVGRRWADTVAASGHVQVRQMLDDARTSGVSHFHQVRQRFPSGLEVSVEYTTVRLGGEAGLIAIGRNLEAVAELRSRLVAAQASMERDYWKLREVETRYRLLFDASSQPVLLVGAEDMRIAEANPAAIRALGVGSGCELLPEIFSGQRDTFKSMLLRVREQGKAPGIVLQLGPDRQAWLVRASMVAAEPTAMFVLQLAPAGTAAAAVDRGGSTFRLEELVARLPEAFVVVDTENVIMRANRAFAELIEHAEADSVVGQRLSRWLSPAPETSALLGNLHGPDALPRFHSTLRGELGRATEVVVSAAGNTDSHPRFVGVLLRRAETSGGASAFAGLLGPTGKSTLKEIVQEAITSVERQCIEAALALAKGNRTVAAQQLGLSRQSLYLKLNRYAADSPARSRRKK